MVTPTNDEYRPYSGRRVAIWKEVCEMHLATDDTAANLRVGHALRH